ncbi:hypothetical protein NQ318_018552 [Aromia moschata]|uniref:Uncharacterized protein n=1 Tax=Aromia moschata TaxID=1265417 RepID=A0AAV8ZFW6_9CUCU|nr:hypothetical protein NQ318_018552 [Aromia moschata]
MDISYFIRYASTNYCDHTPYSQIFLSDVIFLYLKFKYNTAVCETSKISRSRDEKKSRDETLGNRIDKGLSLGNQITPSSSLLESLIWSIKGCLELTLSERHNVLIYIRRLMVAQQTNYYAIIVIENLWSLFTEMTVERKHQVPVVHKFGEKEHINRRKTWILKLQLKVGKPVNVKIYSSVSVKNLKKKTENNEKTAVHSKKLPLQKNMMEKNDQLEFFE